MTKRDRSVGTREAVDMITRCQRDRLPYVLAILERAGYVFPAEEVAKAWTFCSAAAKNGVHSRKERSAQWVYTDDPAALLLREAYLAGVSFTDISRLTGINRTVLYEYLKGARKVPVAYRDELMEEVGGLLARLRQEVGESADG